MKTSIVILTLNQLDYTKQCIESIRQYTNPGTYEIIVVDNASTDGTPMWLSEQTDIITIFNSENLGFPKGCNQGIEIATGDAVLLLNNDTIVTHNWLENMLVCLMSDSTIGAVGAITNHCSYYQSIQVTYSSLEEMHRFAEQTNQSDPRMWEERLKLVGYCMLIRRSVVDQVGLLDERFTPGNYEDDDYSLRIREAGYRLILCRDTFIHHYGSVSFRQDFSAFSTILQENQKKYIDKWSFSPEDYLFIDYPLINTLAKHVGDSPRILQIGCGCGGTLLWLRTVYPQALLYGVESNPVARGIASAFSYVYDHWDRLIAESVQFDAILVSNHLHRLSEPEQQMKRWTSLLKPGGSIFIATPNAMHYPNLIRTIRGQTELSNTPHFTKTELESLIQSAGFTITSIEGMTETRSQDEQIIKTLALLGGNESTELYETKTFLIRAKSGSVCGLENIIMELAEGNDLHERMKALQEYEPEEIVKTVVETLPSSVEVLNLLATVYFQNNQYERVLPFLSKALEMDADDTDTLFNLGFAFHEWSMYDIAFRYIDKIPNRDEEAEQLFQQLQSRVAEQSDKERSIKFLLRRIEFGVDLDQCVSEMIRYIQEGVVTSEEIGKVVDREIVDKKRVLQQLSLIG